MQGMRPFSLSMKAFALTLTLTLTLFSGILAVSQARVFTDTQGRRIDAEVLDVREENVILKKDGKTYVWPLVKLSVSDQLFLKRWKATHAKTRARVQVRLWEKDGIGPSGTFEADEARAKAPKGPPILSETKQRAKYKHYEVDLTNTTREDATKLTMSYVVFLIDGSGRLIPQAGSAPVDRLSPGERARLTTRGATLLSTKTVNTRLSIHRRSVRTKKDTSRSRDRFGGVWVRVYSGDQLIGEKRDLEREVEKLDPAWTGPVGKQSISIPELLEALPLPKLPERLPKLPKLPFEK